jgi:hypothetical protein
MNNRLQFARKDIYPQKSKLPPESSEIDNPRITAIRAIANNIDDTSEISIVENDETITKVS